MEKNSYTILLIDDDDIINYIHKRFLEIQKISSNILIYNSARNALKFLKSTGGQKEIFPLIIFLDLMMPIMNGFQFLEEFEKLEEEIKNQCQIIVLSSTELEDDIIRVKKNSRVINFFSKPISIENLDYLKKLIE